MTHALNYLALKFDFFSERRISLQLLFKSISVLLLEPVGEIIIYLLKISHVISPKSPARSIVFSQVHRAFVCIYISLFWPCRCWRTQACRRSPASTYRQSNKTSKPC